MEALQKLIESAWEDRSLIKEKEISVAIKTLIDDLDTGKKRIAEPGVDGWKVN
ncbi:MAG: 2,3,4,5-tetrahydropyridine-2,6-dicarboxylate N-succinyltransferase, partial [Cyclobacteriaceae bacterium]